MEAVERDYLVTSISIYNGDMKYIKANKLSATLLLREAVKQHREGVKEKNRLLKLQEFRENLILLGVSVIVLMFSLTTPNFIAGVSCFMVFLALICYLISNLTVSMVHYGRKRV